MKNNQYFSLSISFESTLHIIVYIEKWNIVKYFTWKKKSIQLDIWTVFDQ